MEQKLKITIIGAGSMGCIIGGFLSKSGADVTLIDIKKSIIDAINKDGMKVTVNNVEENYQVKAYTTLDSIKEKQDLVIFLVKGADTPLAAETYKPLIGDDTCLMTLQNGIGHVEVLHEYYPNHNIHYGVMKVTGSTIAVGHSKTSLSKNTSIAIGCMDKTITPMLKKLEVLLTGELQHCHAYENIDGHVWLKLRSNIKNTTFGLARLPIGKLMQFEESKELLKSVVDEVDAIAEVLGIEYPMSIQEADRKTGSPNPIMLAHLPSTAQDMRDKKKTEIMNLNGAISKLGRECGVPTPVNDYIYRIVSIIERMYEEQF